MIIVKGLKKYFGEIKAVDGIDLTIQKGELYGLLGPNGAGKTTTISILSTLLTPDAGTIEVDGIQLKNSSAKIKRKIGVVPQEIALYEDLSAIENLIFWGKTHKLNYGILKEKALQLLDMTGLSDRARSKVNTFSGGMKRRLNLAISLIHSPEIVFMDEPTVGIDPQSRNKIYEIITSLNRNGITIIYTTHYMNEAETLCNRIGIIDHGKIIAEGNLEELKNMNNVTESIEIDVADITENDIALIKNTFGEEVFIENKTLTFTTKNSEKNLPQIINHLNKTNLEPTNISFNKTNLESLFLNLTGRKLRD